MVGVITLFLHEVWYLIFSANSALWFSVLPDQYSMLTLDFSANILANNNWNFASCICKAHWIVLPVSKMYVSSYVYMHMCVWKHAHAHTHTHMHTCTHARTHAHKHSACRMRACRRSVPRLQGCPILISRLKIWFCSEVPKERNKTAIRMTRHSNKHESEWVWGGKLFAEGIFQLLQQEVGEQSGKELQSPSELPSSPTHLPLFREEEVKWKFLLTPNLGVIAVL